MNADLFFKLEGLAGALILSIIITGYLINIVIDKYQYKRRNNIINKIKNN